MNKTITSLSELIDLIKIMPLENKDCILLLYNSLMKVDERTQSIEDIDAIRNNLFHFTEKALYGLFSESNKIDAFKKELGIERITITVDEINNTLYATV
jgi:hypothetical protein